VTNNCSTIENRMIDDTVAEVKTEAKGKARQGEEVI
jgi:hypothetical protein